MICANFMDRIRVSCPEQSERERERGSKISEAAPMEHPLDPRAIGGLLCEIPALYSISRISESLAGGRECTLSASGGSLDPENVREDGRAD